MLSTFAELSGLSTQFLPCDFACGLTTEVILHLLYWNLSVIFPLELAMMKVLVFFLFQAEYFRHLLKPVT